MKFLDEYREGQTIRDYLAALKSTTKRQWRIMEICGGQTHSIVRYGLNQAVSPQVSLVHGPGCPVCVTPAAHIDAAAVLSLKPDTTVCSYGDMLRVPGNRGSLIESRSHGGSVEMVQSPLEAVQLAMTHPDIEFVFFAIGFETTAPAHALAVELAAARGLRNFSMIVSHVLVPPALETIFSDSRHQIDGILAAGHVCTITGYAEYHDLARRFGVPIIVTGFEPVDILEGLQRCVSQLEAGTCQVENQYSRAVNERGNPAARAALERVFERCDREWRGIGTISQGGYRLNSDYRRFDALTKFQSDLDTGPDLITTCHAGEVLMGHLPPQDCEHFGTRCTPEHPLGAPMVSSEGACAAYYQHAMLQRESSA